MRTTAITIAVLILLALVYVLSYAPTMLVFSHWYLAEDPPGELRTAVMKPFVEFYRPAGKLHGYPPLNAWRRYWGGY